MKKYLISYGDANYAVQKEFFRKSAQASAFFDEIFIFSPEDIAPGFLMQVGEPLQQSKGGGYWLWKPYFLKKVLENIEENDILIYCDAGCIINPNGKKRFEDYIDLLTGTETGILAFELSLKEYEFTKQEVFDYFNSSEKITNSNQLIATVILIRKCQHAAMLINLWYETACNHPVLFTNDLVRQSQRKGFVACRNDQSIFSVICKTYGAKTIPDETYFLDFIRQGRNFPFWATRIK